MLRAAHAFHYMQGPSFVAWLGDVLRCSAFRAR
jgi:hypothetical protein